MKSICQEVKTFCCLVILIQELEKNSDFVICDQFISDLQGNEDLYRENLSTLNYFDENDITLQRNSADSTVNFYGRQLLELCKYNNIFFFLNGRLGTDKRLPKNYLQGQKYNRLFHIFSLQFSVYSLI